MSDQPVARTARAAVDGDPVPFDVVVMSYEERLLRRRVIKAQHGDRVLVDLAELTVLKERDRLVLEDGRHLEVLALDEAVAVVHPGKASLAALAWHIGNRHTPCDVWDDCLLIQRDHVLEGMLIGLGAEIEHLNRPFEPLSGAYGHGRTHGHSHSHDPHHDPNAHIPHRHHE